VQKYALPEAFRDSFGAVGGFYLSGKMIDLKETFLEQGEKIYAK
jgi:hypothetical protein